MRNLPSTQLICKKLVEQSWAHYPWKHSLNGASVQNVSIERYSIEVSTFWEKNESLNWILGRKPLPLRVILQNLDIVGALEVIRVGDGAVAHFAMDGIEGIQIPRQGKKSAKSDRARSPIAHIKPRRSGARPLS